MGYTKSRTMASGSFSKSPGDKDFKLTKICDVDPMLDNCCVKGRVISIWKCHRLHDEHSPYSLECVLQDEHSNRIQVYIKKELTIRFEPLLEEGRCYMVSNFGVAENSGKLPLLPHKYKLSFYKHTNVTRIESWDDNVHGFTFEPFSRLLDPTRNYHEHEALDIIGSVIAIGDKVQVMAAAGRKVRRTVVLENAESERLDCTFWEAGQTCGMNMPKSVTKWVMWYL